MLLLQPSGQCGLWAGLFSQIRLKLSFAAAGMTGVIEVTPGCPRRPHGCTCPWQQLLSRECVLSPLCSPIRGNLPDVVLHDQRERKELILSREIEEADKGGSTEAETETTSSLFIFQVDTFIAELTVEKSCTCVTSVCSSSGKESGLSEVSGGLVSLTGRSMLKPLLLLCS